jgi:hypothetical protein
MQSEMSRIARWTACFGTLVLGIFALRSWAVPAEDATQADSIVAHWPAGSQIIAKALTERYGAPLEAKKDSLTWYGPGAWKRTVLHRSDPAGNLVEQVIAYVVPNEKIADLRSFDARIHVDNEANELSIRSENPTTNFLLVNLAYEIVRGIKTVHEAHEFYDKQLQFSEAGKTSNYLSMVLFAQWPAAPVYPGLRRAVAK